MGRAVRGAFWLGLGSLAVSVLGVVFWFVVAWRFGAVGVGVAGGEVGVALTAGSLPGCLVALRYVGWRLGWVVVLGLFMPLAGWMLGPLFSVPLVVGLLAVLHLVGVLRVREVFQLARIVLKMF